MKPSLSEIDSVDGILVEVTLKSFSGLTYRPPSASSSTSTKDDARIPNVSVAVGFSGSATDMQVSSSFLCGISGNLIVESQPAVLSSSQSKNNDEETQCRLLAEWTSGGKYSPNQSSSSCCSQAQQPHLTIRLPKCDPKLPSVPLSRMNRGCNVVNEGEHNEQGPNEHFASPKFKTPSLDESETSSQTNKTVAEKPSNVMRGESVVWSASGAAMPEIIELHVSLILEADDDEFVDGDGTDSRSSRRKWKSHSTTHEVGVAYLVFFGSDDGTIVLDLPIKKQTATQSLSALHNPNVTLEEDAFLRVLVNVISAGTKPVPASPEPDFLRPDSFIRDAQALEVILQQLRVTQDNQSEVFRRQLQHCNAPAAASLPGQKPPQRPFGHLFCAGDFSFQDIMKSISGAIRPCDDGEMLHHSDSMGSTIITSESLDI